MVHLPPQQLLLLGVSSQFPEDPQEVHLLESLRQLQRIDLDIEHDLARLRMHVDARALGGEIDAVMDVLFPHAHARRVVAHAALMHVRLVRDDER